MYVCRCVCPFMGVSKPFVLHNNGGNVWAVSGVCYTTCASVLVWSSYERWIDVPFVKCVHAVCIVRFIQLRSFVSHATCTMRFEYWHGQDLVLAFFPFPWVPDLLSVLCIKWLNHHVYMCVSRAHAKNKTLHVLEYYTCLQGWSGPVSSPSAVHMAFIFFVIFGSIYLTG